MSAPVSPKKTFTFYISDEQKAALQGIRERDGVSEAEQIRRGIQMWIDSKGNTKATPRRALTRRKA
jgi:hypothetical protein